MKKKLFIMLLLVFIVCLTGCGRIKVNDTLNSDNGPYVWQVGPYTLETKTNIMKYIDGNNCNLNELAMSLGWNPYSYHISENGQLGNSDNYQINPNAKTPAYYLNNNLFIRADFNNNTNYFSVWIKGERSLYTLEAADSFTNPKYTINGSDKNRISMESIVVFTYAIENTNPDSQNDPFEGILKLTNRKNKVYRYDEK